MPTKEVLERRKAKPKRVTKTPTERKREKAEWKSRKTPKIPLPEPEKPEIVPIPEGPKVFEVAGMRFEYHVDYPYRYHYDGVFEDLEKEPNEAPSYFKTYILHDLWFIVYFVCGVDVANHPFWIERCKDVEDGPRDRVLDLWARGHGKTSIITVAKTIQMICKNPEERIAIFSYSREAAKSFLRVIKQVMESSPVLYMAFPDIFFRDPHSEALRWSEDVGLFVKRRGNFLEATVEAWGLIDGMPTRKHFTHRIYDDVETPDLVNTPEMAEKLKYSFFLSHNLSASDGTHSVIGTTYSHEGLLEMLRHAKTDSGEPLYTTRVFPATDDGTPNGKPVLVSEEKLQELKADEYIFYCQQLLDPTPRGTQKLNYDLLKHVDAGSVPEQLYKFMLVDPAGEITVKRTKPGDCWGIVCIGVEPFLRDLKGSNVYILDLVAERMTRAQAMDVIVDMYMRNGRILVLGVEKTGMTEFEVHIAQALRARGRHISVDSGSLELLRPGGRDKVSRIVGALQWPLQNGKLFLSSRVPEVYRQRLEQEMRKFPFSNDDIVDALSYGYDVIKKYPFGSYSIPEEEPRSRHEWAAYERSRMMHKSRFGWMRV